jgi:hypothetical protein
LAAVQAIANVPRNVSFGHMYSSPRLLSALGGIPSVQTLLRASGNHSAPWSKHDAGNKITDFAGHAGEVSNWGDLFSRVPVGWLMDLLHPGHDQFYESDGANTVYGRLFAELRPVRDAGVMKEIGIDSVVHLLDGTSGMRVLFAYKLAASKVIRSSPTGPVASTPNTTNPDNSYTPPSEPLSVQTNQDCAAAAAYYFPLSQYVTSHFSEPADTGVGLLESVDLDEDDFLGHGGESDNLQLLLEADAEQDNLHAQLYLARRYRWGWGGLQQNMRLSR